MATSRRRIAARGLRQQKQQQQQQQRRRHEATRPQSARSAQSARRTPAPLFVAATLSYVANCALGTAVGLRLIDTRRFRWVHHALYVATSVLAGAAAGSALLASGDADEHAHARARPRFPSRVRPRARIHPRLRAESQRANTQRAAVALLPAAVPLILIPRISARSRRHPLLALTAAPFFAAALVLSRR